MNIETFHKHAQGLVERLRAELIERGCDMTDKTKTSQISEVTLLRASAFRTGAAPGAPLNEFDVLLSKFSSDLYNLMMNFAIRSLPETFDQIALVLRNAPEPEPPQ
jgi:hypothetical protein